jgi:hypothetical protein
MELHSSSRRGDSRIGRGRGQLDLTLFLEGLRVMAWSYSRDLGGEWGCLELLRQDCSKSVWAESMSPANSKKWSERSVNTKSTYRQTRREYEGSKAHLTHTTQRNQLPKPTEKQKQTTQIINRATPNVKKLCGVSKMYIYGHRQNRTVLMTIPDISFIHTPVYS